MKASTILKKSLLLFCFIVSSQAKSQSCSSCTVTVTGLDTLAYVIVTGQTFCIDSTGQFEGTLTLSGGTLCNKGLFNPRTLNASSGAINNYAHVILDYNVVIGAGLSVLNGSQAVATFRSNLTISGGTFANNGIVNVKNNITYSSGIFNNSAIVNCRLLSGAGVVTNSGIINQD